jgi:hypothetical protein
MKSEAISVKKTIGKIPHEIKDDCTVFCWRTQQAGTASLTTHELDLTTNY